ncbi:MAG: amino acid ABC transporter substrate-binding protein [Candidatus Accumulibacter phosphatis]|jgi:glutamate/aspartate transport system substrate-binding protein|uniref:Glutamate/aspartate periplasmic-binding protein n=2 Tax=Candidatus Accumulibacter TaxID=327159 RepID=A0A080LU92_9PROT|nr:MULTISPECIES: amino acid ABC transporter substrate-binding protein [Candidatus Accumulibacter]KFB72152.1 MAG: Glutamate/aspartate periplasmic-binding protein precursor [Candidatus Accumulibacter phosphatis]MBL8409348.1 amino acid ABC transporter substrate-binding protein [Accumulibacter sp.]HRF11834.1 amino acid ABC transporter substrate-binding protein [Candidatus Accumulibacter phosphatis]
MKLHPWVRWVATALVLGLAVPAQAAGTLDKIRASKTIALGYRESSVPFSYTGDDNQPWGYSVDLCTRVAAAIVKQLDLDELQLLWVPVTPETRIARLKSGAIDLECGSTTTTLARMEEVDFSLLTFIDGGSYLSRRAAGIKRFEDLAGKRIAVAAGTTSERMIATALLEYKVAAELVKVSDHQQGIAAMLQGKVEAYASDRSLLIGLALDSGSQNDWSIGPETFSYEPYALMMRRNDAAFRLAVNRELARLSRSREMYAIHDRWFGMLGKPGPRLESLYFLNGLPE